LCKESFVAGDELVICPSDGSRHHVQCWESNQNHCTAYGCEGQGEVLLRQTQPAAHRVRGNGRETEAPASQPSKVRALPTSSIGCAQSCLVLSIALAIVVIAFSCYGLWAILDYVMINELGWQYRTPNAGLILPLFYTAVTRDLPLLLQL
jgi:hypothetical protein